MAKIVEEILVVKLSKLVRDDDDNVPQMINNTLRSQIEDAAQNLVSDSIVVEIERK